MTRTSPVTKEVESLGLPAPFKSMGTTITGFTNNGDATYNVQFSTSVTWSGVTTTDLNFCIFSPGDGGWWGTKIVSQVNATTLRIQQSGASDTDCYRVMLTANPSQVTSAVGWNIAAPIFPA